MNRRVLLKSSAAAVLPSSARLTPANASQEAPSSEGAADPGFRVWFVRSAESQIDRLRTIDLPGAPLPPDSGVTFPLTLTGIEQAVTIAEKLREEHVLGIYASTRLRAIQTADAIAFARTMTIEPATELVEVDFTDPGASVSTIDYQATIATMTAWIGGNPEARAPGGESLTEVLARFLPFVQEKIAAHASDAGILVFVTHGVVLAAALPSLFDNLSLAWTITNALPVAGIVTGGFVAGRLQCIDWAGQPPV